MSLSHFVDVYTNDSASVPAAVGDVSAQFSGTYPTGYYYDDFGEIGNPPFQIKIRIALGTSSGTYTIFSSVFSGWAFGGGMQNFTDTTLYANGLVANTLYYFKAQISDDAGATWTNSVDAEGSFTTTNSPVTPPVANFSADTTTGQGTLVVEFTDSSTNTPSAWEWDFGDGGAHAFWQNPVKAYLSPGTFTVTLTATNLGGSDSEVKASYIHVVSGAPAADFTVNTTTGIRPLTVTFTDLTSPAATSWDWNFGDSNVSVLKNPTNIYQFAGTYTVTLIARNSLGTDTETKASFITVLPIPASATFTATPTSGSIPLTVQFFGVAGGDTASVSWAFGDAGTATELNPLHTFYTAGTYTPSFTVYGTTGAGTSTATRAGYITANSNTTYREFLDEMRRQLLLNVETDVCSDFVDFGGVNVVLRYIYNRICRLQLETGLLRKTSTTITAISAGALTLPSDLIEIRSIYADGVRLEKVDPRMADMSNQTWQSNPGTSDYVGWYLEPGDPLTLYLVPARTPSTFEVYYVYAPDNNIVTGLCTSFAEFPLDYIYWWIIKYGVMADLLSNEGEMYDIQRAQRCEQLFQEGLQLIKFSMQGD